MAKLGALDEAQRKRCQWLIVMLMLLLLVVLAMMILAIDQKFQKFMLYE